MKAGFVGDAAPLAGTLTPRLTQYLLPSMVKRPYHHREFRLISSGMIHLYLQRQ